MPALTSDQLQPTIKRIRDLIGDASSDALDCGGEFTDAQVISEINNCQEMARYERSEAIHTYAIGGSVDYKIHRFFGNLAGDFQLLDSTYTPLTNEQIVYADPLAGIFETSISFLSLYLVGTRVDVYLCAANLLRSLRLRLRNNVDTTEMGISLKLSQVIQNILAIEESYRPVEIGSISFSRSDVAC